MKNAAKVRKIGRHQSLVTRLREETIGSTAGIATKLDAIGEALAYLIEKKHMKLHAKKRGG